MDLADIRATIAAACRTVTGLEASPFIPDSIDPPFAFPGQVEWTYHETVDEAAGAVITLKLLTSRAEDQAGQELLDALLGPVKTAIEAATGYDMTVSGGSGYRLVDAAGIEYYGAELTVLVLA